MTLDPLSLLMLAAGLAMDSFAVSIAMGGSMGRLRPTQLARLALAFGGFQGLMPVLGYLAGRAFREQTWVAAWDHWIAFGLLGALGGKMLWEALVGGDGADEAPAATGDPTKSATLLLLAIATSIDALAVGASLALLRVSIALPSLVIGATAGTFSAGGALLGRRFGAALGKRMEIAGGLALIAIGLRILVDHLLHPTPGELAG